MRGRIDLFSGDRPGFGNRRSHAAGCVPERLGSAVVARLRTLVSERNHVSDSEPASPARTSRSCGSSHLRHRWNAQGAAGGAVHDGDGSHSGGVGRVWRGLAAARTRRPVLKFAARAAGWNSIILLRMLIRLSALRPSHAGTGESRVVHCLYSYRYWGISQLFHWRKQLWTTIGPIARNASSRATRVKRKNSTRRRHSATNWFSRRSLYLAARSPPPKAHVTTREKLPETSRHDAL